MSNKNELVELYFPGCMVDWQEIAQKSESLAGFVFLRNYGTKLDNLLNFDENLSQYFFDNANHIIPHGALCAYFCGLGENQSYWIKADPVQYILDMNKGFITAGQFESDNYSRFIPLVSQFLSQDNLKFNIIDKHNALIGSQKPIDYNSLSLVNIINQSISFDQISGQDKSYFQKLSAELQLLFRQHKSSEYEPDGLYFWGAGELPIDKPNPKYNKIISNHYSVLGLAKLAGVSFEKLDFNKNVNFDLIQEKTILIITEEFSLHWRSGNRDEFNHLSLYFDKMLLELINMVKNNKLKKLILNVGDKTYQITKGNIIKSYFMRFFTLALFKK